MSDVQTLMPVTVRYFAAARAATGVDAEQLDVPAGGTVADLLDAAGARHGTELTRVLARCSYLLDEVAVHAPAATALPAAATVDVLPPFAGG